MILSNKQHHFSFYGGVQLPHNLILVLKIEAFTAELSVDFIMTANFILQQTLTLFCQLHKNFRVSRSLVKDVQIFGEFTHRYFKF